MRQLRKTAIACACALLLPLSLRADMLADYETLFNDLFTNYRAAIEAGADSRIAKDYAEKMEKLCTLGDRIQTVVTRLNIEEIDLRSPTLKLRSVYMEQLENHGKTRAAGKMDNVSGRYFPSHLIKEVVQKLHKMGFTTDNGGSYERKLAKPDGFEEFETLVSQFSKNVKEASDDPANSEWRVLLERRLSRMSALSREIQNKILRELPDTAKEVNLPSEVNYLDRFYKDLVVEQEKQQSLKKAVKNGAKVETSRGSNIYNTDTGRSKKVTEIERLYKEINYTVKKIQDAIVNLKKLGFSLNGKISREAKDQSAGLKTPDDGAVEDKEIAKMSFDEINGALQKERERIYKSNLNMNDVSQVVVKYYVKTLTKKQNELFNELKTKYNYRWKDSGVATKMALSELNSKLYSMPPDGDKNSLGKILERVRKDMEGFDKELDKERYSKFDK